MKKTGIFIAVTIALAITGCGETTNNSDMAKKLRNRNAPGSEAAWFSARMMDNSYISLSDLKGKVVLITFWRKRYTDCIENLDSLEKIYQQFKERGLTVLAINGDNLSYVPSSKIVEFVKDKGYTFPVAFDDEFAITERYRVINVPVTFLIDREGVISYIKKGRDVWTSGENVERIEKLL